MGARVRHVARFPYRDIHVDFILTDVDAQHPAIATSEERISPSSGTPPAVDDDATDMVVASRSGDGGTEELEPISVPSCATHPKGATARYLKFKRAIPAFMADEDPDGALLSVNFPSIARVLARRENLSRRTIRRQVRQGSAPTGAIFATDPGLHVQRTATILDKCKANSGLLDRVWKVLAGVVRPVFYQDTDGQSSENAIDGSDAECVAPVHSPGPEEQAADDDTQAESSQQGLKRERRHDAEETDEGTQAESSQQSRKRGRRRDAEGSDDPDSDWEEPSRKRGRKKRSGGGGGGGGWKRGKHPSAIRKVEFTAPFECPLGCSTLLPPDTEHEGFQTHLRIYHMKTYQPQPGGIPCPLSLSHDCTSRFSADGSEGDRKKSVARHVIESHVKNVSYSCPMPGCGHKAARDTAVERHIANVCYRNGRPRPRR